MTLSKKGIFKASLDGTLVEKIDEALKKAFKDGIEVGHTKGIYSVPFYSINVKAEYRVWRRKQVKK